ncbi:MAG: YceD family protein [Acidimicrobiales bacterium]
MRDPLRIDLVELRRKLATRRSFQREAAMEGLVVGSTFVPEDEPVSVELDLESVSNGVMVHGMIRARWVGECRRCLEPVRGEVEVEVQELYSDSGDADEIYLIEGDDIDLRPLVRDAIVLNLPLAPLCRPECLGPDPERFPALVEGDGPADRRWAGLSELRFDD